MRQLRGILLALALACGLVAQAAEGARARAVLERVGCQTSLPDTPGTTGGGATDRDERRGSGSRTRPDEPREDGWRMRLPAGGSGFAIVLLWVGVGIAAVLLVAAVVRTAGARAPDRGPARPRAVVATGLPEPAPVVAVPADHERLAAAGDFAAAVHALLQQAIARWQASGGVVPRHATARTVLARARSGPWTTDALAHLVSATELVHFGGRPADRTLYDQSLAQLRRWEDACRPTR